MIESLQSKLIGLYPSHEVGSLPTLQQNRDDGDRAVLKTLDNTDVISSANHL